MMMAAKEDIRVCGERLRNIGDSLYRDYDQSHERWVRDLSAYVVKVYGAVRVYVCLFDRLLSLSQLATSRTL